LGQDFVGLRVGMAFPFAHLQGLAVIFPEVIVRGDNGHPGFLSRCFRDFRNFVGPSPVYRLLVENNGKDRGVSVFLYKCVHFTEVTGEPGAVISEIFQDVAVEIRADTDFHQ